jgi:hypothetical protein
MTPVSRVQNPLLEPTGRESLARMWQKTRGAEVALRRDDLLSDSGWNDFARELTQANGDDLTEAVESSPDSDSEDAVEGQDDEGSEPGDELSSRDKSVDRSIEPGDGIGQGQVSDELAADASLIKGTGDLAESVYQSVLQGIDPVLAGSTVKSQVQAEMRTSGALRQSQRDAQRGESQASVDEQHAGGAGRVQSARKQSVATSVDANLQSEQMLRVEAQRPATGETALAESQASGNGANIKPPEVVLNEVGSVVMVDASKTGELTLARRSRGELGSAGESSMRDEGTSSESLDPSAAVSLAVNTGQADSGRDFSGQGQSQQMYARELREQNMGNQVLSPFSGTFGMQAPMLKSSSEYSPYHAVNALQTERAIFAAMQADGSQGASQEVVLRLFPAKLGAMKLRVQVEGTGERKSSVRVQLMVENHDAEATMAQTIAGLQSALEKQGFTRSSIELSVDAVAAREGQQAEDTSGVLDRLGLDDVA